MTTTVLPAARPAASRSGPLLPPAIRLISAAGNGSAASRPSGSRGPTTSDSCRSARCTRPSARGPSATARTVETRALRVEASRDDAERLALIVPGQDAPVAPTHWSYGQLCSLVDVPASYMRQLPASLAGINLQHGTRMLQGFSK